MFPRLTQQLTSITILINSDDVDVSFANRIRASCSVPCTNANLPSLELVQKVNVQSLHLPSHHVATDPLPYILASHSTPDFASLQEQQFLADYESGNTVTLDDGASRSPAPSPQRLQKRPRQLTGESLSHGCDVDYANELYQSR